MPFIPTLTHPCPCKRNKQKEETVPVPLSVCARQQSWPAHLQMYMGTLHFSKAQFFQKFLRVWLVCSTISFTRLHLLSCYRTFNMSVLSAYSLHFTHVAEQISLPFLSRFTFCSSPTMSNCSGCKYWRGMFHYKQKGCQLLAWCFIRRWLWTLKSFLLIKIKPIFWG